MNFSNSNQERAFEGLLYVLCTIAFAMVLLFPALIWVLPLVFSTIFISLWISHSHETGGYLSQLRTVCRIE